MTVNGRSISGPVVLLAGLTLLLWGLFALSAYEQHPIARQSSTLYRLLNFSSHATRLANGLNSELLGMALVSGRATGNAAIHDALKPRFEKTDIDIQNLEKTWGRFNGEAQGKNFIQDMARLWKGLERHQAARDAWLAAPGRFAQTSEHFSRLNEDLLAALLHAGRIENRSDTIVSRNRELARRYETAIQLSRMMARGVALLEGNDAPRATNSETGVNDANIESDIRRFVAANSGASNANELAQSLGHVLARYDAIGTGGKTGADLRRDWIKTVTEAQTVLLSDIQSLTYELQIQSAEQSKQSNFLFVLSCIAAALATIALIACFWPGHQGAAFLVMLVVFDLLLIAWELTATPNFLARENGPMELLQALTLLITFALFLNESIKNDGPARTAAIPFAAICFVMFFREFDFRTLGAPEWVGYVTTGTVRRVVFSLLLTAVAISTLYHYRDVKILIRKSLTFRVWPLVIWPFLLVAGEYVEYLTHETRKDDLAGYWIHGQFWEEFLELNGYLALLYGASIFASLYRQEQVPGRSGESALSGAQT